MDELRGLAIESEPEILLVEDNPDDVLLAKRAFKKNGYANGVVVVHDGIEALDYLFCQGSFSGREADRLPRLILLDLKLPKIDGIEVLRRLRADERTRLVPVVVLTTSREERDILSSYGEGANSYLQKPLDLNAFVDVMGQLLHYWLVLNQPLPQAGVGF